MGDGGKLGVEPKFPSLRDESFPPASTARHFHGALRARHAASLRSYLTYPQILLQSPKNWIHLGSPQAGPKVAAILSVVESCRRLKIGVRDYLAAVLPGLADTSIQRLAELTPAAWAARNQ